MTGGMITFKQHVWWQKHILKPIPESDLFNSVDKAYDAHIPD